MKSRKVVPASYRYSTTESETSLGSASLSSIRKQNNEKEQESKTELNSQKNDLLRKLLSFKLFIISVINTLVIITVLSIWLTSYLMNSEASSKTSSMIVKLALEKVSNLIHYELGKARTASLMLAQNYNSKSISETEPERLRKYQFSLISLIPVTSIGLNIGENGISNSHAIILSETPFFTLIWYEQRTGEKLYSYNMNLTTGDLLDIKSVENYSVSSSFFYKEAMNLFKSYPNGGFGSVYLDITNSVTLHYSSPIYDQTFLPKERQLIGVSKANILLVKISEYLSTVKIMTKGYLILTEYTTDYVIGASLQLPPRNGTKRIHAYEIIDRNAGDLMREIQNRGINSTNEDSVSISIKGTEYLVSISPYTNENIIWKLTVVLEKQEVAEAVLKSTYVIVGVSIATMVLGLICSFGIGFLISVPFDNLTVELKRISVLDLDQVETHSSYFTEIKDIYFNIHETVGWLKEFKTFIPESILEKVKSNQTDNGVSFVSKHSTFSGDENFKNVKNNIFSVGLLPNSCTVLFVIFTNLDINMFSDETEFADVISKVIVSVTSLCKTFKADCHTKNYDRFKIVFNHKEEHISPLELALKIKASLNSMKTSQNKISQVNVQIGICKGKVFLGNVGCKQSRYPAAIGEAVFKAMDFAVLNSSSGTNILMDEDTFNAAQKQYICLPVDRYKKENSKKIETVYQLVGRNEAGNEEWMVSCVFI